MACARGSRRATRRRVLRTRTCLAHEHAHARHHACTRSTMPPHVLAPPVIPPTYDPAEINTTCYMPVTLPREWCIALQRVHSVHTRDTMRARAARGPHMLWLEPTCASACPSHCPEKVVYCRGYTVYTQRGAQPNHILCRSMCSTALQMRSMHKATRDTPVTTFCCIQAIHVLSNLSLSRPRINALSSVSLQPLNLSCPLRTPPPR